MIYEFRTYILQPRTMPEFLKRFEEMLPKRQEISPLAACWFTEVGSLNEVTHVWPYENMAERSRLRAEAVKANAWPPKVHDLIVEMKSEIFEPLPFSPPLTPSDNGPIFEMRSYVIKPASTPQMAKNWTESLPERLKLSPLTGVFTSELGGLNQWVHIWAYKSMEHRAQVRDKAMAEGIWPPKGPSPVVRMQNRIMLPASFSPIR